MSKICFITAIYGNYETSCKNFNYELFFTDDGDTWIIQKNI